MADYNTPRRPPLITSAQKINATTAVHDTLRNLQTLITNETAQERLWYAHRDWENDNLEGALYWVLDAWMLTHAPE